MDLSEIKQTLESKLETLTRRLAKIESHLRDPGPKDSQERATAIENDEVLERLDERERGEIEEIRTALSRIEQGSYLRCSKCGGDIPERRLAALPYTQVCVSCAT